jgi:hypothetical protein
MKWNNKKLTHEFVASQIQEMHPNTTILNNYKNAGTLLKVICDKGHYYEAYWSRIKVGRWCNKCLETNHQKISTETVVDLLNRLHPGAKLLDEYTGYGELMRIICDNGHPYKANYYNLKEGKWCKKCKNINLKPTVEILINFCKKFNITLLNEQYDGEAFINFVCHCGKQFSTRWFNINYNKPICCNDCILKITINDVATFIKKHHENGKLIDNNIATNEYIDPDHPLLCKCRKQHIFETSWNKLHKRKWCPDCLSDRIITLDIIKEFVASKRKGECLEVEYKSAMTPMKFKCKRGHIWEAKYKYIKGGTWCPTCSSGFGEEMSRYVISKMTGYNFEKIRLECLMNEETGRKLELDGYCNELKMAFEYQGRYHKEIVDSYKMTDLDLDKRKRYDKIKKQKCKENDIFLIEIPQFDKKFRPENLVSFIENKFIENKINIPYITDVDLSGYYDL